MGNPKQLENGRWQMTYLDGAGRKKRESFDTYEVAVKTLRARRREVDLGLAGIVEGHKTFDDVASEFMVHNHMAVGVESSYERNMNCLKQLKKHFGGRRVLQITLADVDRFSAARLSEGRDKDSVNKELRLLRRIVRLGVERKLIPSSPLENLKPFRVRVSDKPVGRAFQGWEVEALHLAATSSMKPLVMLYAYTGVRLNEGLHLRWTDVDFEGGWIHIQVRDKNEEVGQEKWKPKTAAGIRKIPIHAKLLPMLQQLRNESSDSLYVFVTKDGERRCNNLHRQLQGMAKRAGLVEPHGVDFQCFRRGWRTQARRCGIPHEVRDVLFGHGPRDVAQRHYDGVTEEDLRDAMGKFTYDEGHIQDTKRKGLSQDAVG